MSLKRNTILFMIIFLFTSSSTQPLVPYRAWQFHKLDIDYVSKVLQLVPRYNINTVVFSHGMIGETSQLYDGSSRGTQLIHLANEAHNLDLKVWIWIHELDNVPEKYLKDQVVQMDRSNFWDWLEKRYEKLFKDFPEFDGLMLTFHESQYRIFRDSQVNSKLVKPDRFAKMINTINKACRKFKKDFVVRTFLYEPVELEWVKEGLLKSDRDIIVQSKCVPHDWDPFYPPNPLIGAFPQNRQIIEFDCSSEFTGKNRIPYTSPEYFERHWRYDLQHESVVGYNARLDHNGFDAVFTPNEINLYTLYRLTEDASVTADQIWEEWIERKYGLDAALYILETLYPTFEIVNKTFFPLKFWTTNKSVLPSFSYANGHISSRTIAKWIPENPHYKELEDKLNHPDPKILERILAEQDTTMAMAKECLLSLQKAKPFIAKEKYEDLYWRLDLLSFVTMVWRIHLEAFYGYKVLKEGHQISGLKERLLRAVNSLFRLAEVSEKNPEIGDNPPASAKEIRQSAVELSELIDKLNIETSK